MTNEENPASANQMTLDEYKALVRREALRVQNEMGWCDDGLNETLRNLGLPEKFGPVRVPVRVRTERIQVVTIEDAENIEDAHRRATDPEYMAEKLRVDRHELVHVEVVEEKDPDLLRRGDFDTSYEPRFRNQCGVRLNGRSCTRARHDTGQHVANNGEMVTHTWAHELGERVSGLEAAKRTLDQASWAQGAIDGRSIRLGGLIDGPQVRISRTAPPDYRPF